MLTAALACAVGIACSPGEAEVRSVEIGVVSAPSLSDALTEIIGIFEGDNPGVRVHLELGLSQDIAAQLPDRTDVNLFASASQSVMARSVAEGTAADPVVFAQNHVVLAVQSGNPRQVTSFADLARPDLRVGLCSLEFPCGEAAEALLAAADVVPPTVDRAEGSRALAARLADNGLDVGIIYRTDVAASHGWVEQADVDERERALAKSAGTTRYTMARVPGGEQGPDGEAERAAAEEFRELVTSERGRRALEDAGLDPLPD